MLKKSFSVIVIISVFVSITNCSSNVNKEESNSEGSWKNLRLSRIINENLIKMLDKEEVFEKMYDLFQNDKTHKEWSNKMNAFDESNDDEKQQPNENNSSERIYRDTFADSIQTHADAKRTKRNPDDVNNEKKETRMTGDTILHIKSEVSDVIKSETDIYDVLKHERKSIRKTADSYVDGIMIHPSKFVYNSMESKEHKADYAKKKNEKQNEYNILMNIRKGPEVSDDYDDSIRKKYGQVLKSKRELSDFQADVRRVEVIDSEVLSELNTKQVLECSLPEEVKTVTWYKDGEKVVMGGRIQTSDALNYKHLTITGVTREDEGQWMCMGKNLNGTLLRSDTLNLVVLEAPSAPYLEVYGRRLDPSNLFLPVKEASELKLTCRSEGGRPPATLHWDPAPIELHVSEERTQGTEGAFSSAELLVRREHHNISISCVAVHPALEEPITASILLHVQYAPRFSISRIPGFGFPLAEGSAAALKCEVDSNPPSSPHWRKDEMDPPVPQSDDGFLNFTSVLREHSGWYKCIANHVLGNYSSIGYFLNVRYEADEVTKISTDIQQAASKEKTEVALGGAVQLHCPPESFGCWGRPSSKMEVGTPPGILKKAPSSPGMLYEEDGQYKCKGLSKHEAEHFKALRDANITIQGGPTVFPKNKTIFVTEGQLASLQVEICSSLPLTKLIWLTPDQLLHMGSIHGDITAHNVTESKLPECVLAKLVVENVGIQHAGEYSLVARSAYGLQEALMQLSVRLNSTTKDGTLRLNSSAVLNYQLAIYLHVIHFALLFVIMDKFISV